MMLAIVSILFLVPFCFGMAPAPPTKKESVLNFYEIAVCDDGVSEFFIDVSDVSVKRINETTAILRGDFGIKKQVPDQFVVELIIHKETNGRYEVFVTEMICNLCDELAPQEEETTRQKIIHKVGFPEACPIPVDVYTVKELVIDSSEMPINTANEGKYMVLLNVYTSQDETCKELEFIGCITTFFAIEPLDDDDDY